MQQPQNAQALDMSSYTPEQLERARQVLMNKYRGVNMLQPIGYLEPFFECNKRWRIIDGSNRSGKTQSCALEYSRAVLCMDPYDKYVKENGNGIVIARKEDELAGLWRKLTHPCFKIIRDEHTKEWRAVRPDPLNPAQIDPYDMAYREKWKDGPPLIDINRDVKSIAWESTGEQVPRKVYYRSGYQDLWLSSNGQPPNGDHYTVAWIDEQIKNDEFFQEINRGLVRLAHESIKHRPKGIWSATAQTTNIQLDDLRQAASRGEDHVGAFNATIINNPYVPPEERQEFLNSLTEEEKLYRFHGHNRMTSYQIYKDNCDVQGINGCEPFDIPEDWARYVVLDPGSTHCGIMFAAVDPQEEHTYIYDAIDFRDCAPTLFAQEVAERQGDYKYEAIVVDKRMGQQRSPGQERGQQVARPYSEALEKYGVVTRTHGSMCGMHPGNDNISYRELRLLEMMNVRDDGPFAGTPRLKIFRGRFIELEDQIRRAHLDPVTEKRNTKVRSDLLDCLEYLAAFNPQYYTPERILPESTEVSHVDFVWQKFQDKTRRQRRRR